MTDLAVTWDRNGGCGDLMVSGPDLMTDDGLYGACLISLFTDRAADPDDQLPDSLSSDRRGWWGDALAETEGDLIGSKLWLLYGSKIVPETLRRAKDCADEALAWLVTDGVAKTVAVTTSQAAPHSIGIGVDIVRPDGTSLRYEFVWEALENGL